MYDKCAHNFPENPSYHTCYMMTFRQVTSEKAQQTAKFQEGREIARKRLIRDRSCALPKAFRSLRTKVIPRIGVREIAQRVKHL